MKALFLAWVGTLAAMLLAIVLLGTIGLPLVVAGCVLWIVLGFVVLLRGSIALFTGPRGRGE